MSVITTLDRVNIDAITSKPPRAMGKAKMAFLENIGKVSTPKLTQAWPIRPSDDTNEKQTLEVRLDEESELFTNALRSFDQKIRKLAFENRATWFSKNVSAQFAQENDLSPIHHKSISAGNEKPDGTSWGPTTKFKITGWKNSIKEVLYKGEEGNKFPVDVVWNPRLVDAMGHGGPDDSQTKFFLSSGKNMATGQEIMVGKVPCQDPAGNHMRDSNNNLLWEFVGPKHCQPGSKLTIIFQPSMVWLSQKFGVSLVAKQIFITPPAPKPRNVVPGIEIVDFVDPILASRAVQLATVSDDLRDLEEMPSELEFQAPEVPLVTEPSSTVEDSTVTSTGASPKKRAAPAAKGGEKKKKVSLDEEF